MPSNPPRIAKRRAANAVAITVALAAATAIGISAMPASAAPAATSRPDGGAAIAAHQATEASGFPTFVNLPADQAAHPVPTEWWYTTGHFTAAGQQYGYLVDLTAEGLALISFTDVTTHQYYESEQAFAKGTFSVSSTGLEVRFPDASLTGPMDNMRLSAQLPGGHGSLDLTLDAKGPVLYDNGTGLFPLLGGASYYYSLPNEQTTGTMTFNGKTTPVTGQSWLDRQWGNWDFGKLDKWTWMGVQLGDDEYLNLWDVYDNNGEHVWATVLNPDGSENVVAVEPLAPNAGDFQTSPASGQRYVGRWVVQIPSLHTRLTVTADPVVQDFPVYQIDEAISSVSGTFENHPVTGTARVEQLGQWN